MTRHLAERDRPVVARICAEPSLNAMAARLVQAVCGQWAAVLGLLVRLQTWLPRLAKSLMVD